MLETHHDTSLAVLVVWEPVIWSDVSPPTSAVLGLLSDTRVAQYWDPQRALSSAIVRSVLADPGAYPAGMHVEVDTIVWDAVALFPAQARWSGAFPVPEFHGYPVVRALAERDPLAGVSGASAAGPRP